MKYPRLDSSDGVIVEQGDVRETKIIPLFKPEEKQVDIKEYVEEQGNQIVVFIINWIKTAYTNTLMNYLNTEFKQEIIKELKK